MHCVRATAHRHAAISRTRAPTGSTYISSYQIIRQFLLPTICPTIIVGYFVVDVFASDWSALCKPPAQNRAGSIPTRWPPAEEPRPKESRQMTAQELLARISDYCRQTGLAESTFGRRAVNDGKLANRLRNGGRITTETVDRIQAFMNANRGASAGLARVYHGGPRPMSLLAPSIAPGAAPSPGAAPDATSGSISSHDPKHFNH